MRRLTRGLIPTLSASILVALLSATFALSYAAVLFAGTPPATQAEGLVMLLVSSLVLVAVGARLSSLPCSVLFADGTLIALLAAVTAEIIADMAGAAPAAVAATLTALLTLATVATGAALWLIGRLRGGRVVRFLPFPVMAGVLAAGGWSLSAGGAAVALGHPVTLATLGDPASALKLALTLLLACLLLAVSTRLRNPTALPGAILLVIALYHAIAAQLGWSPADQRASAWLLTLPDHLTLTAPWSPGRMSEVAWPVLGRHVVDLLALIPVTASCLLLAISGIETLIGRDLSADRDLRANGLANIVTGALGGVLGITSVGRTTLLYGMGARGPAASLRGRGETIETLPTGKAVWRRDMSAAHDQPAQRRGRWVHSRRA